MRYIALLVVTAFLSVGVLAADPAEEARQSEIAFAKAFADRNLDRFMSMVAEDAHFLGPANTLSGKAAVREGWGGFFTDGDSAPFRWEPKRVVANAAGTLALSTGPVYNRDGKQVGQFSSVWQKQTDGSWKVVFDGPGSGPPCPPTEKKKD
jgi:ketosteroid isomerase-like protein